MNEIIYVDFNQNKNGWRGRSINRGAARLHYVTKESDRIKNPYYCITLNNEISEEIRDKGVQYLRLGNNPFTGEIYLVFCKEETPDAAKISFGRGHSKCISIYSKGLVEKVMEFLEIPKENDVEYLLNIGENKSRIADAVCLQINKFNV